MGRWIHDDRRSPRAAKRGAWVKVPKLRKHAEGCPRRGMSEEEAILDDPTCTCGLRFARWTVKKLWPISLGQAIASFAARLPKR